jgi:hypothetical protein
MRICEKEDRKEERNEVRIKWRRTEGQGKREKKMKSRKVQGKELTKERRLKRRKKNIQEKRGNRKEWEG